MNNQTGKTIWYCHPYAGAPSLGMSYRPYYLTKEFSSAGYNAYVISAHFHHLLQKNLQQKASVVRRNIDGVPYITLKTLLYKGSGVRRIFNMLNYVWHFKFNMKAILKITGKPDVIIVSSAHPFHYPVLERFARKNNTKLIFEVRDLWPLSLMKILNTPKWHPLVLYLSYIEKRAYKNADHVVSLLGGALAYMKNKGLSEERYHFIPNGTSINDHQISSPLSKNLNEHIQNLKRKNTFMLGYAGALGKPNALIYLIEAMRIIQKENHSIHCMIVGNGHLEAELKQAVLNHGLKNISFFSAIDKLEVGSFLKQMNALYLGWNDTDIYKYGVSPNKLYDYMLAGCPIIESGGADQSIIEQVECGIRCEAANVFAIAEAIKTMSLMEHKERVTMGLKGQQACINKFDYSILARDYMTVFAS